MLDNRKEHDGIDGGNDEKVIEVYKSRYVVPLYYESEKYPKIEEHFEKINKCLEENGSYNGKNLTKNYRWAEKNFWKTSAEIDIYSYLLNMYKASENRTNLGTSWVLENTGTGSIIKGLCFHGKKDAYQINFSCESLGALFFRNGIGFIWYDIKLSSNGSIAIEKYAELQNAFKELARTHNKSFTIKTFDKENKAVTVEPFNMGEWLTAVAGTDDQDFGIEFWAKCETTADKETEDGNIMKIPDKSLLFQYAYIKGQNEEERKNWAFRLANGYNEKYNPPKDITSSTYDPFDNMSIYISNGGMACIASDNNTNEEFFRSGFPEKYVRDYFFIYMMLVYQLYSCAYYAKLLAEIPADAEKFTSDRKNLDNLESLSTQINLFLVKGVFGTVSNIHHHNGTYTYGKKALSLDENIGGLTIGLDALMAYEEGKNKMLEEKEEKEENKLKEEKEKKLSMGLIVFGFLVFFSAALDALNLVDWLNLNLNPNQFGVWHLIVLIIVVGITIFMLIEFLRRIKR